MTRFFRIRSNTFPSHGVAIAAICLALAITFGCQPGESPNPKGAAVEPAAKPDKPGKIDDSGKTEKSKETPDTTGKTLTGRAVLERMVAAYRNATSYVDVGKVHLLAEADGQKVHDDSADFSLAFVRPNKVHVRAYNAELVCDGKKTYAYVKNVPGQVFSRPAPERLTVKSVQPDLALTMAMNRGFAGGLPQIALLFGNDPLDALLRDISEPELSESGQIGGHDCYRVKLKGPDGLATFWVDKESYVIRRIVMPTDSLREVMSQDAPINNLSVVADFTGAQLNGPVDPKAFEFEVPQDAKLVDYLVPPHMGQLLNKKVPEFKAGDLAGKPIATDAIVGKTAVLVFWTVRFDTCRQALKSLEEVYQKYKNNPKVAIYAVCVDPEQLKTSEVEKAIADLNLKVPVVRDIGMSAAAFNLGLPPVTFIINDKGIVQHCESDLNPKYAESLQTKLDKVLAGEEIYQEPMKQFLEQVEQFKRYANAPETTATEPPANEGPGVKEERLPEPKTAERSEPSTFKLSPLWKCANLKTPGNIVVLSGKAGPERLLAIESWNSVAELGLDGKVIDVHKLDLDPKEVIGSLRTAVGADGRRYSVVFMVSRQRCHVYDENWKLVTIYPEDALENPHSGIADVKLGDLEGDGKLKMYVSYWGVVGVQAVSLDGKRIWSNRANVSNVASIAIGDADAKGRRDLYCTNNTGAVVVLGDQGERRGEINVRKRLLSRIADADLRGDGRSLWCGLASQKLGENTVVGFSLNGEELWNYPLPTGIQMQLIEPIVAGKVTRDGPGQWLLPGPDGSIHILSADGKPLDRFNYGSALQGLATFDLNGQPVLVVASQKGLEAWKVE